MNERDELVEFMHARNEFDYDECPHGTYSGGASAGEPYAMCERQADALIRAGYRRLVELDATVEGDRIVGAWGVADGVPVHIRSYKLGKEAGNGS